jgi:hypothetical protein
MHAMFKCQNIARDHKFEQFEYLGPFVSQTPPTERLETGRHGIVFGSILCHFITYGLIKVLMLNPGGALGVGVLAARVIGVKQEHILIMAIAR